ncbi:hypothetical protein [Sphingobacterium sp. DR205]|uniref:hypothetical protein n=1 Tax=Sphingobacterium sp. DR205 TaxID=2713573 RepID=UPI0013E4DF63|nr:hypothetical protein [Sphingobacterium sp. DR205]QIH33476.1 hypothetical protein G6053_11525 [Sphingobacterium sp. DR205]
MFKPALTPYGVNQKTTELYAFDDNSLLAQAALISVDIVTWIVDNFELTAAQYNYLIGLDPGFLAIFKDQASRAVANRWPVAYIPGVGTEEISSAEAGEKWIKSKEENTAGTQSVTDTFSGSLTIETGI